MPPHPDLSQEQRDRVLTLHCDANLSQRQISQTTSIPLTTVNRIITLFNKTGVRTAQRSGRCGAKRLSSSSHDRLLLRTSLRNPRLTAIDIKRETGTALSTRTVQRRLNEGGRIAIKAVRKPLLTKAMKQKRYEWSKVHRRWTLEQWKSVRNFLFTVHSFSIMFY